MKKGIGLPVFPGVAIGPAVVYRKAQRTLPVSSGDPAIEKAKFEAAEEMIAEGILEESWEYACQIIKQFMLSLGFEEIENHGAVLKV